MDLLNDPGVSDCTRLRKLEELGAEIEGHILDLRDSQFPS
jgi:hypothetical protein